MQYSQLPIKPVESVAFDAGIIASDFDVKTGVLSRANILFATSSGSTFNANLQTTDIFEDMDNAKSGTMQGLRITGCDPHLSTTVLTMNETNIDKVMPNVMISEVDDVTA